jgi:hypothetical protein
MYHDRTAWRCASFVGKKYGCSKGYPKEMNTTIKINGIKPILIKPYVAFCVYF